MPYFNVDNFARGMDRSRPIFAAPQGAIWKGINGHITRGGDFEGRKEFVRQYSLPPGTFGLQETATNLYVFSGGAAPSGIPAGVTHQTLAHPSAEPMTAVLSSHLYDGKIYAIAKYADGEIHRFYNGTIIADWGAGAGNPPGVTGSIARTHKRKVYDAEGSTAFFSAVDDATGWTDGTDTGAGFINISNHDSGNADITGIGRYQSDLALFTEQACHIWFVAPDDDLNAPVQVVSSGTISPRSVISFGDQDLFYLSQNGIRSIRARQNTDTAAVNDVGTPIDTHVIEFMRGLSATQVTNAVAVIEPEDNRFWLAIGTRIYVFSYFPTNKIAAWTYYEPGIEFSELVVHDRRVYGRSGNDIYVYGGASNDTYYNGDNCLLWMPFITLGKPGSYRDFSGMDIAAIGSWECRWYVKPELPEGSGANSDPVDEIVHIGELDGVTYQDDDAMGVAHCNHVSPWLRKASTGYASISRVSLYYAGAEVEQG